MNNDRKIYLLLFFAVALVAAEVYLFSGISSLGAEAGRIRGSLVQEISNFREKTADLNAAEREQLDRLLRDVDATKRESTMAAMLAKYEAQARAEQLAADIARAQRYHREEVGEQITGIKTATAEANERIGSLRAGAGIVKEDVAAVKDSVNRTAGEVERIESELTNLNALVARNREELESLRANRGDLEYTEFSLPKSKQPKVIGGLLIVLKNTDPSRNVFTLSITGGGETVEQKDRTIDEPLRVYLGAGREQYEIVVNQVAKDRVSGYVVTPKSQMTALK